MKKRKQINTKAIASLATVGLIATVSVSALATTRTQPTQLVSQLDQAESSSGSGTNGGGSGGSSGGSSGSGSGDGSGGTDGSSGSAGGSTEGLVDGLLGGGKGQKADDRKPVTDEDLKKYTAAVDQKTKERLKQVATNAVKKLQERIDETIKDETADPIAKYKSTFYLQELKKYFEKAEKDIDTKAADYGFNVIAPYLIAKYKNLKTGTIRFNGQDYENSLWADENPYDYEKLVDTKEQKSTFANDYGDEKRFNTFVNGYFDALDNGITDIIQNDEDIPKDGTDYKLDLQYHQQSGKFFLSNSGPSDKEKYTDWQDWIKKKITARYTDFDLKQAQKIIDEEQPEQQTDPLQIIPGEGELSDPEGNTTKIPESFNIQELRNQQPWLKPEYVDKTPEEVQAAYNADPTKWTDIFFFKNPAQSRLSFDVKSVTVENNKLKVGVQITDKMITSEGQQPKIDGQYQAFVKEIPETFTNKTAYTKYVYQSTQSLNNIFDRFSRDGLGIDVESFDLTKSKGVPNQVRVAFNNISTGTLKLLYSNSFTKAQNAFIKAAYDSLQNGGSDYQITNAILNNSNILFIEYLRTSRINQLPIFDYLSLALGLKGNNLRKLFKEPKAKQQQQPQQNSAAAENGSGQNPATATEASGAETSTATSETQQAVTVTQSFSSQLHQAEQPQTNIPQPETQQRKRNVIEQLKEADVIAAFAEVNIPMWQVTKLFDRMQDIKIEIHDDTFNRTINPLTWFDGIMNKAVQHSNIYLALFSAHQDILKKKGALVTTSQTQSGLSQLHQADSSTEQETNNAANTDQSSQQAENSDQANQGSSTTSQPQSNTVLQPLTVAAIWEQINQVDQPSKVAVGIFAVFGGLGAILAIALIVMFLLSLLKPKLTKEKK